MSRLVTITALALMSGPALAAGETPFEKVKGWEVERSAGGPTCLMSKAYKDPNDDNAENALVFALAGDQALMTFSYQHWTWAKNEKLRVPLVLDGKVAIAKSAWTGDGQTLTAVLPKTLVPDLLAARTMVLKLDGADADFNLAGFSEAYGSLRRCDAVPAKEAAAPATAQSERRTASAPAPAGLSASAAAQTESAHITLAMTFPDDGSETPPQTVFARDTPKVLLRLALRDVKTGDKFTAAFIAENTAGTSPNFTIASLAIPVVTNPVIAGSLSKPDAGWPAGQYRIDVSYNDGPVEFSHRFAVK